MFWDARMMIVVFDIRDKGFTCWVLSVFEAIVEVLKPGHQSTQKPKAESLISISSTKNTVDILQPLQILSMKCFLSVRIKYDLNQYCIFL